MELPLIISFELSEQDATGVPVSVAWSLPDGRIKSTVIAPEDEWLEQLEESYHDWSVEELYERGHSARAVLAELRLDAVDAPIYCADYELTLATLERLAEAAGSDLDLALRPVAELLADQSPAEVEMLLDEARLLLDVDPFSAEGNTRLWLEVCARLL